MAGSTARSGSVPPFAARVAVRASIFFSSSATRLSVFFCVFLLGAVTMHVLLAFAHLLQDPVGWLSSGSHLTLSCRHASQARGRFMSLGSCGFAEGLPSSGLSCVC